MRQQSTAVEIIRERVPCKYDYYGPWEGALASTVAKYFFCESAWVSRIPGTKDQITGRKFLPVPGFVWFYGTKQNVEACIYAFDFYRNVVNDVAWKKWSITKKQGIERYEQEINSNLRVKFPNEQFKAKEQDAVRMNFIPNVRKFVLSFYQGAAAGIGVRLREQFETANQQMGVIPSYGSDIKKYKEDKGIREKLVENTFQPDLGAYIEGVSVGKNLLLNKGVN